ncbi:MAG: hypothetical protein EBQ96_08490 [Proteobacteria bacterium]|nr:hypothetical protein [Pseudomonadota bacterium]
MLSFSSLRGLASRAFALFSPSTEVPKSRYTVFVDDADFEDRVTPETVAELKNRARAQFAPVMDVLSQVPADDEGRTYRFYVMDRRGILDGQTEVEATVGFFNDREEQAFLFFNSPEGGDCSYDSGTGIRWTEIHGHSYDVELLISKSMPEKTIYRAMLPPPANDADQDYHSRLQVTRSFDKILETLDRFLLQRMTPNAFPDGFKLPKEATPAAGVAGTPKGLNA